MSESITELRILEAERNIFDTDTEYIIPLYQRAYAWEDKQLSQLIEDINDVPEDSNYYIGTLIVSRQGNRFEVVDGQQRLTSLFLLLNCLGFIVRQTLTFACRDKSNYTLKHIKELLFDERSKLDMEQIESSIEQGLRILTEVLNKPEYDKDEFRKKLEKVVLYRIEVPKNTDLNRYFEIMNTRGEQLEQHDILKASLMGYLWDDTDKAVFAKVWDACSDMTGYVQMHFVSKNNELREKLFGWEWNRMPPNNWVEYRSSMHSYSLEGINNRIKNIIDIDFAVESDEGYSDDDARVRFDSIVEFPYFLLHTLKVLIAIKGIRHEDGESSIIPELLDDKKLVESFERVIRSGMTDSGKVSAAKDQFSKDFIICLLKTRFLFDKYIIKREYANDSSDGEWSLKSLCVSGRLNKKKPYYRNSRFVRFRERDNTNERRIKTNTMLQAALRVSYTSPKAMHWITQLLLWLSEDDYRHSDLTPDDMANYDEITEAVAQRAVKENFFDVCGEGPFALGINTPHIVFNYLDFLLWKSNRRKYEDFVFEFRNSVEHWYPRNPSEGTFEQWKDGVDRFGNLCIIPRGINSKFSNLAPEAKKSTFRAMISKGSLKLRIMSDLTEGNGERAASLFWKETLYKQHEDEMLNILRVACGIDTPRKD